MLPSSDIARLSSCQGASWADRTLSMLDKGLARGIAGLLREILRTTHFDSVTF